ncbi:MAG: hypothetical protein BGO80_15840 [Devosia sp. 63-57]|nr:MAG: hypothetical protein ABS74_14030 [Pelagibacterium sp. SCN 63-126]ODU87072.1 MAG: hypothetical protein ABT14_06445 [Pelagibacterium sp. SCN 63-17]OJX42897.1 MAG: hypothetical protein BGO80_15840 [Devosia sp. 63-57]
MCSLQRSSDATDRISHERQGAHQKVASGYVIFLPRLVHQSLSASSLQGRAVMGFLADAKMEEVLVQPTLSTSQASATALTAQ